MATGLSICSPPMWPEGEEDSRRRPSEHVGVALSLQVPGSASGVGRIAGFRRMEIGRRYGPGHALGRQPPQHRQGRLLDRSQPLGRIQALVRQPLRDGAVRHRPCGVALLLKHQTLAFPRAEPLLTPAVPDTLAPAVWVEQPDRRVQMRQRRHSPLQLPAVMAHFP